MLGAMWSASDPKKIHVCNQVYETLRDIDADLDFAEVEADLDAPFGFPAFNRWLDLYDVFEAIDNAVNSYQQKMAKL